MRIRELKIHNWRSVKDLTIAFQDLMILIGQNNHGKSNILSAILFFFGEITIDQLDFCTNSEELSVEISFDELDENDKTTFKKYITSSKTIRVRREAIKGNGCEHHGYVEVPTEDWLKEDNISDYTSRDVANSLPLAYLLPDAGRITKDIFRQAQENYIQEQKDSLIFNYVLETGPFLGAKNVAKGIFGEVYYVPSVKKATEDLSAKGKSVFSELYARVINKMSETNTDFQEAKGKIVTLISLLNKTNEDGSENISRPVELTAFEESLQQELDAWDTTIDVEITPPNVDDLFRIGATVWIDDGVRTDVAHKGHGLQRALIFALVRSLAKLTKKEREVEATSVDISSPRHASKSIYFILEEPELYLHPQAQRQLYDSLVELSTAENQVVVCTHSSSFLSLDQYRSICIIRKNSIEEGTTAFQCTGELLPDADDMKVFDMTYWINPDRGELFFAKRVVLVEGPTDKTVIPLLANDLGIFKHEYTIIDCGSKDAMPNYIQLLNKFKIPYVAVYDRDHQEGKSADAITSVDKSSNRVESSIDGTIGASVIFENDIEEEIGITVPSKKKKPYFSLVHIQSEGFAISDSLKTKINNIYT